MKRCIWCSRTEENVSFIKEAHTFPKSLGGNHICENVCDSCNHYFGSQNSNLPAVEVVLKEILNVSRFFILTNETTSKNNRYKSAFFNINWKTKSMRLKPRFSLKKNFQEKLGRQFRRGIFKVYLEERESQKGDAHNSKFNFIREFARYDLNDYPIYYLVPKLPVLLVSDDIMTGPTLPFTDSIDQQEKQFGIYCNYIMGHTFCIPTSRYFEKFSLNRFKKHLVETNNPMGTELVLIKYTGNVDFTFSFLSR